MLRFTGIMGMFAAFAAATFAHDSQPSFRAPTRRRKGRIYSTRSNRPGRQRLKPAIVGGNWKGQEYLTYAEHDQCNRVARQMNLPYEQVKAALLIERRAA